MDVTALGSVPIPGENPAGFDAKYEPEYDAVLAEIDKLSSATQGGPVSWSNIVEQSRIILETKSKDISIAAYMGVALQKIQGLQGFLDAINLFISLFSFCWETAFPPLNRLRKRTNAFEWWHEHAYADIQTLENKIASPLPDAFLHELLDALERLDQLAGELMPDALPLRDLREAVRRLPSLPPEPAATPKESAEPEPAPPVMETPPVPAQPPTAEPQSVSAQTLPVVPVVEPEPSTPPPSQPSPAAASARLEQVATTPAASSSAPVAPSATLSSTPLQAEPSDDAKAARKEFVDAACKYAFLAHKETPHDPLPWQLLRLALWSKVATLPPSENGQTYLPPPDSVRLKALYNLLESGKPLEAALGAEDLFAASLFCLDAQAIIDEALGCLGPDYAQARERVREETMRFVHRLSGVETLNFTDGTPFACSQTKEWLQSLEQRTAFNGNASKTIVPLAPAAEATSGDAVSKALAEAEELFKSNGIGEALAVLENSQGTSLAVNMTLRVGQLRFLCQAGETAVAVALARDIVDEIDRRELENWDRTRAVEALLAVRDAFALARDKNSADAIHSRIARLRPSAAIGWRQ